MTCKKRSYPVAPILLCYAIFLSMLVLLSGCADRKTISFKINSVPKGAHVLYRVVGGDIPCQGQWIYLGNTPLQGVRQFGEEQFVEAEKITLKVMHNGFHDQVKEWDGAGFWEEVETHDVIFWAPELVPSSQE